nr:MAG TPA: hypothetical protein [Caudoviricetes sp.]
MYSFQSFILKARVLTLRSTCYYWSQHHSRWGWNSFYSFPADFLIL